MATNDGVIVSIGIDWITGTTKSINAGTTLSAWAGRMMDHEVTKGYQRRHWGMAGFEGYSAGHIQLARRDDECMVRLSGVLAKLCWRNVYRVAENITRFDVQVTHRSSEEVRTRIRRHHKEALSHCKQFKRGPSVALITSNDGGDTLYLGKRQSEVYARIYNKEVESKDKAFAGCVRYEVEFKGQYARAWSNKFAGEISERDTALACLYPFLVKRGIKLPMIPDR